tara:strand:- start:970 stop:1128 length:159 start_codon:yes stop_codon:yes gene_type:complete
MRKNRNLLKKLFFNTVLICVMNLAFLDHGYAQEKKEELMLMLEKGNTGLYMR